MGQQFMLAVALTASVATAAAPTKPNIVLTLTDDLGWNTAWNNDDIISPTLDALASQGLKLSSFYVYRYCSPTRAAFLTGRSPYKLLNIRENLIPTTIPQSTDPRFTMLPKRLAEAGYKSYLVGKWHQGFAKKEWTPTGRGFTESWGFLSGGEDHFTQINEKCTYPGGVKLGVTDYWRDNGTTAGPISTCDVPAADRVSCVLYDVVSKNSSAAVAMAQCAAGNYAHCAADASDNKTPCFMCKTKRYTGFDFSTAAVGFIEKHAAANAVARQGGDDAIAQSPFFLYLALHNTHGPIEAPAEYVAMYNYSLPKRNTFDAMVSVVDSTVANVTEALKKAGMWSNTLFIWTTDNGSPCQVAGSNDPLRGNKGSDWEGGARVPAFISGGMLPSTMAGRTLDGIVAIWDLFATACGLAGIDPTEPNPASPTPVDSFDMWGYLSGAATTSPRTEVVYDHLMFTEDTSACTYGGMIQIEPCNGGGAIRVGDLKLLVGTHGHAGHYGHFSPNRSWHKNMSNMTLCSLHQPCLFNVTMAANDLGEADNLASRRPADVARLLARFHSYDSKYHPPSKPLVPDNTKGYCDQALHNGGFATFGWAS